MKNKKLYYIKKHKKTIISLITSIVLVIILVLVIIKTSTFTQGFKTINKPLDIVKNLGKINSYIHVECTSNNKGDDLIIVKSKVIANFDNNKKISNYSIETKEKNISKEIFLERKKMYDEIYEKIIDDDYISHTYQVDENKRLFTFITYYKRIDLNTYGEEERNRYKIKNFIKTLEDDNYKCEIIGISRKEIGLK